MKNLLRYVVSILGFLLMVMTGLLTALGQEPTSECLLININNKIWFQCGENQYVLPVTGNVRALSPDKRSIFIYNDSDSRTLYQVALNGEIQHRYDNDDYVYGFGVKFSPDGQYAIFFEKYDLQWLNLKTGEIQISPFPQDNFLDNFAGWYKNNILFTWSNTEELRSYWVEPGNSPRIVPRNLIIKAFYSPWIVISNRLTGESVVMNESHTQWCPLGSSHIIQWKNVNEFWYQESWNDGPIYHLDLATCQSTLISSHNGILSPDGAWLAYFDYIDNVEVELTLVDLTQDKTYQIGQYPSNDASSLEWSPSSKYLIWRVKDNLYYLNPNEREILPLIHNTFTPLYSEIFWSGDGKTLYWSYHTPNPVEWGPLSFEIEEISLTTGEQKSIFHFQTSTFITNGIHSLITLPNQHFSLIKHLLFRLSFH